MNVPARAVAGLALTLVACNDTRGAADRGRTCDPFDGATIHVAIGVDCPDAADAEDATDLGDAADRGDVIARPEADAPTEDVAPDPTSECRVVGTDVWSNRLEATLFDEIECRDVWEPPQKQPIIPFLLPFVMPPHGAATVDDTAPLLTSFQALQRGSYAIGLSDYGVLPDTVTCDADGDGFPDVAGCERAGRDCDVTASGLPHGDACADMGNPAWVHVTAPGAAFVVELSTGDALAELSPRREYNLHVRPAGVCDDALRCNRDAPDVRWADSGATCTFRGTGVWAWTQQSLRVDPGEGPLTLNVLATRRNPNDPVFDPPHVRIHTAGSDAPALARTGPQLTPEQTWVVARISWPSLDVLPIDDVVEGSPCD